MSLLFDPPKTAVLFDFDGTLGDTVPIHDAAFATALAGQGLDYDYRHYLGQSTKSAMRQIFERNGRQLSDEELAAFTQRKKAEAHRTFAERLQPIAGADDCVRALHAAGLRLFVGSSGSRLNITTGLKVLGWAELFEDVVTADDVTQGKPHPEIFLSLMERNNLQPETTIVVEDAISGVLAGIAAELDTVCIERSVELPATSGNAKVFHADLCDLPALLLRSQNA